MRKPDHVNNLKNILHYAFEDLINSVWKFVMKRQNRFKYFEQ